MLGRARKWSLVALIAASFGFTGLLRSTAIIAQAMFYAAAAFALLSVLFCLFEECGPHQVKQEESAEAKIIPLPSISEPTPPEARAA